MNIFIDVLTICFSSIALAISILAYIHSKKSRVSSIFTEITQQANLINEASVKYNVKGPYACLLNIKSNNQIKKYQAVVVVFFHHINLLNLVYRNRKFLGDEVISEYKKWVKTTINPWFESNNDLIKTWELIRENGDYLGKDFIKWLEPQLRIKEKISKNRNALRKNVV